MIERWYKRLLKYPCLLQTVGEQGRIILWKEWTLALWYLRNNVLTCSMKHRLSPFFPLSLTVEYTCCIEKSRRNIFFLLGFPSDFRIFWWEVWEERGRLRCGCYFHQLGKKYPKACVQFENLVESSSFPLENMKWKYLLAQCLFIAWVENLIT